MLKRNIAIFLTVLFVAIVTTPTIIYTLDNTIDISNFYNITEEEETKGKLIFNKSNADFNLFSAELKRNNLDYYAEKYLNPYFNIYSEPPDFI